MKNIAVRELAYFMCRNGNLTIETFSNREEHDGNLAHRFLQAKYQAPSKAEVYIKSEVNVLGKDYLLHGYIDGLLVEDDEIIIEEIKSTNADLDLINLDDHPEHLAQAKLYAYLYCLNNDLDKIHIRLTYISLLDYDIRSFDMYLESDEVESFTFDLLEKYAAFDDLLEEASLNKENTINEIKFPYKSERKGQRDLMKAVYQALRDEEILYTIAPTGIGKTMATIFPALKTLGKMDKLFYLTAKGSGKNAPIDAMKLLEKNGLKCKTIDITAKSKICNKKCSHCNPDECEFAIGYYDRLKGALTEIYENYNIYDSELITKITNKHKICAFEFSLYLSYYCDLVIADYNYVFDPHAHLVRYFEDDTYKPKVLVDEAHNLVSRGKDMYSAILSEEKVREIRANTVGLDVSIRRECNILIDKLNSYRDMMRENALYVSVNQDVSLDNAVTGLVCAIDNLISVYKSNKKKIPNMDKLLDGYYNLLEFSNVSESYGESHRFLAKLENDMVIAEYVCLDASKLLLNTINDSIHGIVFFSATLYPIDYNMNLITAGEGKYLGLESPFDPNKLDLIINNNVSTKLRNREASVDYILEAIETLTNAHKGNYIVFFPSYKYLEMVRERLDDYDFEIIVQESNLTDSERNDIINKFKNNTTETKLGMFVLGGAFSEGVDLIGDALSGVIIVGVGLPMICDENNILKDYFEIKYQKGFDYAYTYPGFTKVIQAVGRVIRDDNDRGVAILMDERFTYNTYKMLYPPHWKNVKIINNSYNLGKELEYFYKDRRNKNGL
ncbi:MAG: ATP-dependent DNA helicase [Acholeplasmatales bacterium]|nr:ATP-dependent DNA helicase [Acholeplasmatales bacterium]